MDTTDCFALTHRADARSMILPHVEKALLLPANQATSTWTQDLTIKVISQSR